MLHALARACSRVRCPASFRQPALARSRPAIRFCAAAAGKPAEAAASGAASTHTFQAETAQLLQIVAKSLYKDKEVFLRELISNAADANEKRRYLARTGTEGMEVGEADKISITTDKEAGTLTIADSGIGMSEKEVHDNLGQIASSGTKAFMQGAGQGDLDLIGQFGVGFYSVFMVSEDVQVYTRSARGGEAGQLWSSGGYGGAYTVAPAENVEAGTTIVIKLNEESKVFADENYLKDVITKYSNFVTSKIELNGNVVNTIAPLWTLDKSKVTDEQHDEFYRYLTKAWDKPQAHLWYAADAPLSVKALFYIPGARTTAMSVLIEAQCEAIVPDWMRFVKGVVDSEDVPLNISRETMQDSALIRQLNKAVTSRAIKWLRDMGKNEEEKYKAVFGEFGNYIKEGVCIDNDNKKALLPLLRFSSSNEEGKLHSFDDYVKRMPEGQDAIYYLSAPDFAAASSSPYYEVFKEKGYEVLFMHEEIDDYMMGQLPDFDGKKIVNAEGGNIDFASDSVGAMSKEEQDKLCEWIKETLGDRVQAVRATSRLVDSPCIVVAGCSHCGVKRWQVNHESATMRKLSKLQGLGMKMGSRQELEVNTSHPILARLGELKDDESSKEVATKVAEQLLDNSLLAAGVLEEPHEMVQRLNSLLEGYLETAKAK